MSDSTAAVPQQSNLKLWDQVSATDPAYTRGFNSSDGFNGTAVNPIYNIKKATECFGPLGIGWGYDVIDERYINGAPLGFDGDGNMWGTVIVHVLRISLWYMLDGKRGECTHYGQTTFVGKGTHGIYTDEDAPKKSLTDALGKCLSQLGFSADVYLGLYDDSKYVESVTERFKSKSDTGTPALTDANPNPGKPSGSTQSVKQVTGEAANSNPGPAKGNDPKAWIDRVRTFTDDGHIEHARKEVPKFLKGEDLKSVRTQIDKHQFDMWLKRIPVLSRANLPGMREKAPKTFSGEALASILTAIDAREANFRAIKPGLETPAAA